MEPAAHFDAADLPKVPRTCFSGNGHKCNFGDKKLDSILGKATWPTPSPMGHLHAAIAHTTLLEFEDDFDKLKKLWLTKLLQPGMVVLRECDLFGTSAFMVCESYDYGAIAWPCTLVSRMGHEWVSLDRKDAQVQVLHCTSVSDFMVMDTQTTTAQDAYVCLGAEAVGFNLGGFAAVCRSPAPLSLLKFALRNGFRGLTVAFLRMLMVDQHWQRRPRPANEREVVLFVASQVKTDITEAELEEALAARGVKACRASLRSAIEASDAAMVEEACGENDAAVVEEGIKQHEERISQAKKKPRKNSEGGAGSSSAAASSTTTAPSSSAPLVDASAAASTTASSSGGGPVGPRAIVGEEFTKQQGRAFLPVHTRFSLVIHTGHAWLVKDSERKTPGHKSRTASWGGLTGRTHRQALFEVLLWAWERFSEDGLGSCPYDLRT